MKLGIKILSIVFILILFTACEQDLLKPEPYLPDNADLAPLFNRDLLMDEDGDLNIGYRNYHIRADQVTLSWQRSEDENFLCYRLLSDNSHIATIADPAENSFTHDGLPPDTWRQYTIATVVETGMNKADTISIKTASLESPDLYYKVNHTGSITLLWKDRCDIPGDFVLAREGIEIATIEENLEDDHEYSYTDSGVLTGVVYNYELQKAGIYSDSQVASANILNSYVMNPPNLAALTQTPGEAEVNLAWSESCSGETGFRIYRKMFDDPDFELLDTVDQTDATEYTDSQDLEYGVTYQYAVSAIDANHPDDPYETALSNVFGIVLNEYETLSWDFDDGELPDDFETGGDAPWDVHPGGSLRDYCLRSGTISHSQESWVSTLCDVPKGARVQVDFDYRVSSEQNFDFLRFYINNDLAESWSGNSGWQHHSIEFDNTATDLEIRFTYAKDSSVNSGLDRAFIDNLVVIHETYKTKEYTGTGGAQ